jgi:hypothetical protein
MCLKGTETYRGFTSGHPLDTIYSLGFLNTRKLKNSSFENGFTIQKFFL